MGFGLTIGSDGPHFTNSRSDDRLPRIKEAAADAVVVLGPAYRLRGGVFTSEGSCLRSSLRRASVGSGSSKNTSHMIQAASGTRAGSFMSVLTRLCALGGRFATPSDAGWGIEVFATDPDDYQWVFVAPARRGSAASNR